MAYQSRTQQRGGLGGRVALGQGKTIAAVRAREVGIAAVDLVAGEARAVAQVLESAATVAAGAASPAEPGDADARAGEKPLHACPRLDHFADDFVPGNERRR